MSKSFTALGLMSGTSLDGIDAAIIDTDGEGQVKSPNLTGFRPYSDEERALLLEAIEEAKNAYDAFVETGSFVETGEPDLTGQIKTKIRSRLAKAEELINRAHFEAVKALLEQHQLATSDIDVVALHGQTVLHRPEQGITLQLGRGKGLADSLNIPVVDDFRSADMVAGGQGAPLVPIYHQALARAAGLELPVAVVNVGGVANVTYVGSDNELIAFDTGPGNALLNDWVSRHGAGDMDEGGRIASRGRVKESVLSKLLANRYFSQDPPKSLDRNHFSVEPLEGMSLEWGAMTLTSFTALAVSRADFFFPSPPEKWVICGGGVHNPVLMDEFKKRLSGEVLSADQLGWSSDFMEAEAFAYLAVRSLKGLPLTFPQTTGVDQPVTGGVLHRPQA